MDLDWNALLVDQLDLHWRMQARPRLDGLTDAEYFREPVPDCWTIRPRGAAGPRLPGTTPVMGGSGAYVIDFAHPEPDPAPVSTIAWQLGHIIVGVFGQRTAAHFGGPPVNYLSFDYAGTAAGALAQLDEAYQRWRDGVRGLGTDGLAVPCGPAEGPHAQSPLAELVLHINREALHHLAEVALLRDLYRGMA